MLARLIFVTFLIAFGGSAHAEPRSASKLFLYSMLTDAKTNFELVGVKTVARDPAPDQETTDIVAELLIQRTNLHVADGVDLDTTSWLMKALGASKSVRYRTVIEHSIAVYANEKVSKFGELSLAQLTTPSANEYSAGSVSLDNLRSELKNQRVAVVAGSKDISQLKPGHDLEAVFAIMGYPDEILEAVESKGHLYVKIHVHTIRLQYFGHGLIEIQNQFAENWGWRISEMWTDIPNGFGPYTGNTISQSDAALIMSTEPMGLRKLAGRLLSQHVTDPAVLDRVAEQVRYSMSSQDDFEADAIAFLCRLLGEGGNKKYIEVLRLAADNPAGTHSVRSNARAALEKLEASP